MRKREDGTGIEAKFLWINFVLRIWLLKYMNVECNYSITSNLKILKNWKHNRIHLTVNWVDDKTT